MVKRSIPELASVITSEVNLSLGHLERQNISIIIWILFEFNKTLKDYICHQWIFSTLNIDISTFPSRDILTKKKLQINYLLFIIFLKKWAKKLLS